MRGMASSRVANMTMWRTVVQHQRPRSATLTFTLQFLDAK